MTRNKHIWIFNAGNSYSGNPKWLFEYIRRHHPDIRTVWMCYHKDIRNYVKRLGYEACLFDSTAGKTIMKEAGVYVVEMCKEVFQPELEGITILNLWHGVGCKSIERKVTGGFLQERIAKNKKSPARHRADEEYILSTKLYCGKCMTFMVGESGTARNKETYRYYKCLSAKRKRGCDKKAVKKKWIEDISTPVSFLYSFSFFHLVA